METVNLMVLSSDESEAPPITYDEWYGRFKEAIKEICPKQLMWLAQEVVRTDLFRHTSILPQSTGKDMERDARINNLNLFALGSCEKHAAFFVDRA